MYAIESTPASADTNGCKGTLFTDTRTVEFTTLSEGFKMPCSPSHTSQK